MREKLNLDDVTLTRFTMLLHGNYGVGKTFLLGDMLRTESHEGPVRFVNMKGEDGYLSIAGLGLGEIGESVDTADDFRAILEEYSKLKLHALAIDGLHKLSKFIIKKHCGERAPSVGKGSDDWTKIHRDFDDIIGRLRWVAPIVVCTSASDRSMDQVSGETSLTPDFAGRQAAGSGGMFDFVFIVRAQPMGPGRTRRWLQTQPAANMVIRSRLPKSLPGEIELPDGGGGWKNVTTAIYNALGKGRKSGDTVA